MDWSDGFATPFRLGRQRGGWDVMFWAGICGDTLIGPFIVEEGVKMDSETYAYFLKQHFVTGTRTYPAPSRGNASICMVMPHHMLPGIREIFWLRKGSKMLSLWCGHQRIRTSTRLKTSSP